MQHVVVEGYGPSDIIARLKQALWEPCKPSGENFREIEFGDRILARPRDPYCNLHHRVTVAEIPWGDLFQVEGYNFDNLCEGVADGSMELVLAGYTLIDPPFSEIGSLTPYRVTIEII